MKNICGIIAVLIILLSCYTAYLKFTAGIDMTEPRFFLTYWPLFLGYLILALILMACAYFSDESI